MTDEQKLLVKKFLYACKNAIMAMDIETLKDEDLSFVYESFGNLVNSISNEIVDSGNSNNSKE